MVSGKARKLSLFGGINTILMIFVAAATVYPILYIVAVSFSDTAAILQNKVFLIPRGFNLEAYRQMLSDSRIPRAYMNTILYTSLGTLINLLMTALAAYPLSQRTFWGRRYFMFAIVLTLFFNGGMIPTYMVVQKLHLIDSIWSIVLPNAIWTVELLILKSFFESLPESLRESAVIDGASERRILFHIVIPLSAPALASIGLFFFMGNWNSYFLPMIYLNRPELYPLQVVLRDMLIFDQAGSATLVDRSTLTPAALKDATIFISMIPVMALYPIAQRYFANGIMLGAEKG